MYQLILICEARRLPMKGGLTHPPASCGCGPMAEQRPERGAAKIRRPGEWNKPT